MRTPSEFRNDLIAKLGNQGFEIYKENSRLLSLVEDKAQKTITIAGAFLGLCLTLVNSNTFGPVLKSQPVASHVLLLGILALLAAVFFSFLATRIRLMMTLVSFSEMLDLSRAMMRQPDYVLNKDFIEAASLDLVNPWTAIHAEQTSRLQEKARLVNVAQALLAIALVCCGISTILCLSA